MEGGELKTEVLLNIPLPKVLRVPLRRGGVGGRG